MINIFLFLHRSSNLDRFLDIVSVVCGESRFHYIPLKKLILFLSAVDLVGFKLPIVYFEKLLTFRFVFFLN